MRSSRQEPQPIPFHQERPNREAGAEYRRRMRAEMPIADSGPFGRFVQYLKQGDDDKAMALARALDASFGLIGFVLPGEPRAPHLRGGDPRDQQNRWDAS